MDTNPPRAATSHSASDAVEIRGYGNSWVKKKTITLDSNISVVGVGNEIKSESSGNNYITYCKIKFFYADGTTAESGEQTRWQSSYASKTYVNPTIEKLVNKVEVWMKENQSWSGSEYFERNTVLYRKHISLSHYLTLNIPQYSEQNATHFRVKVGATREGDDDIWFELVNEDNSTKTYTNADFNRLLPIQTPIVKPTRLRIYMKPATSGATMGGTSISSVYWCTSNPKSLWTGTNRVVKDEAYSSNLGLLKTTHTAVSPNSISPIRGFRLVRRP